MKKLTILISAVLIAMLLFGCNASKEDTSATTVGSGVAWSQNAVDKELLGTWQIENDESSDYYIFTENRTLQIVRGSLSFEGNVTYGIDTDGNHKYLSDFNYMAGELTYVVEGDKAVFVNDEGVTLTFVKAEYTAPKLEVYKDFNKDNPLVGTWYNEEYKDTYTFGADGTAIYELDDTENACLCHIDYTYNEADGVLLLTFDAGSGVEQSQDSYTITGDTLNIIGLGEYTRK